MDRLTSRDENGRAICKAEYGNTCDGRCDQCDYDYDCFKKLADYEDTDLTPEEFKESVDFILELNKKVRKVIEDLKYYLDTNEENGVVYIPKFVIEKIVNDN